MEVVILGAGISGLAAARLFSRYDHVTLIEKNNTYGGMSTSYSVQNNHGIFTFDIGGHFFHYHHYPEIFNLINQDDYIFHKRKSNVVFEGETLDFPIQNNYINHTNKELVDIISRELGNRNIQDEDFDSLESMMKFRYGGTLYKLFFEPYNRKMYGVDDLSLMKAGKMEKTMNVKVGGLGYNADFIYPKYGGIFKLMSDLHSYINDNVTERYNSKVTKIDTKNKTVTIVDENNQEIEIYYDYLISSIPLILLSQMVDDPEIAYLAEELSACRGCVINLGVKLNDYSERVDWTYYPDISLPFYRVGSYSTVSPSLAPKGFACLYIEVSPLHFSRVDNQIVQSVIKSVIENTPWISEEDDIVYSSIHPIHYNYPFLSSKSDEILDILRHKYQIYSIGRYGTWKWLSMHSSMIHADEVYSEIRDIRGGVYVDSKATSYK